MGLCLTSYSHIGLCSIVIPAAYLYAKGRIVSLFSSYLRLVPGPTVMSAMPLSSLSIVSSAVSYLGLQYCLLSRITRRVCSIVIHAANL